MPAEPLLLHPFPSTHWTLVARAGGDSDEARHAALAELLGRYMPPLRSHLIAAMRLSPDHADDMLQGFLSGPVLEKDLLGRAHEDKGRFRNFLLVALGRYVINQFRDAQAQKRAPEQAQSLETLAEPASPAPAPEETFDLPWARHVLQEALDRMKRHCQTLGRPELWRIFDSRVLRPSLDGTQPPSYTQLMCQVPFDSPSQASNALITAKRMFIRSLRSVIAEYEPDEQQIDAEIADLRRIISHASA
jgi:DNA-directed RNA polymerase specialized sigma24 family protein